MQEQQIRKLAQEFGFSVAFLNPEEIPVNPEFRHFCQENLCGKYGASYACPPACGSPEEMHRKILAEERVVVFLNHLMLNNGEMQEKAADYNAPISRFFQKLCQLGYAGFAVGFTGCSLCQPCKYAGREPCAFPEKRMSCMSAYCVDVAKLAQKCGLEFAWKPGELFLFGMIAFHKKEG